MALPPQGPDFKSRVAKWWTGLEKPQKEGLGLGAALMCFLAIWIGAITALKPTWQLFQTAVALGSLLFVIAASVGLSLVLPRDSRTRRRWVMAISFLMLVPVGITAAALWPSGRTLGRIVGPPLNAPRVKSTASPRRQYPRPRSTAQEMPQPTAPPPLSPSPQGPAPQFTLGKSFLPTPLPTMPPTRSGSATLSGGLTYSKSHATPLPTTPPTATPTATALPIRQVTTQIDGAMLTSAEN